MNLELEQASDSASARELVADDEVEVAIVVAPRSGEQPPRAEILIAEDASPPAQAVVALVPDALTRAAGGEPAVQTQVQAVASDDPEPSDLIEPTALNVLFAIVFLAAFVAMMVVPIQTAEEFETGTFGALRLAATAPEILSAKALAGYVFAAGGAALMVVLTGVEIHDPLLFFGSALALIVSLVGFGLLMGLLVPNSNTINTYAAFFLTPLVGVSLAVFFVDSGIFAVILDVLPFSQAAKLLANGISPQAPFDAGVTAWLVIAAWAVAGYAVLAWVAPRREI